MSQYCVVLSLVLEMKESLFVIEKEESECLELVAESKGSSITIIISITFLYQRKIGI